MFADDIFNFYKGLRPPMALPNGVETLFPQENANVMKLLRIFVDKFYSDTNQRALIFGINPGRYGAGATGINFTAPKQLTNYCGIPNELKQQTELSAEFIYEMIESYGGCNKFYGDFFISAVSPLGYVKGGVNMNYYADKTLQEALTPFIIDCINEQYHWKINKDACICIGGEKNFKFLSALNEKNKWFKRILPLPHPRFILQYKRKQKQEYIAQYLDVLNHVISRNPEASGLRETTTLNHSPE